jgi:hypothetical protein
MEHGALSTEYEAEERNARRDRSGDESLHGNCEVGWHQTWYGAESARLAETMQQEMADANRSDEWRLIEQLEAKWKAVE